MKVGHVSFLGLLNHTQMRACSFFFRASQFSGFERAVKHWIGLVPVYLGTSHALSDWSLRSVPGYALPFTEQTEHIQKRARLQPVGCACMLTLNAGDSVAPTASIFWLRVFSAPKQSLRPPLVFDLRQK